MVLERWNENLGGCQKKVLNLLLELRNVLKLTFTDNAKIQVKLRDQYLVQDTKR